MALLDSSHSSRGPSTCLFQQAPGFVCYLHGPTHVFLLANAAYFQLVGHRDIVGMPVRQALPEVEGQGFFELLDNVFSTGEHFVGRAMPILLQRALGGPLFEAVLDFIYQPIRDDDGVVEGILVQGQDVTERVRAEARRDAVEAALRVSEERYRTVFSSIDDGFCVMQMIVDAVVAQRTIASSRRTPRSSATRGCITPSGRRHAS